MQLAEAPATTRLYDALSKFALGDSLTEEFIWYVFYSNLEAE